MNEKQNIKNIDLSQLTNTEISILYLLANAFYGGPEKYINTPEYKELYQKIIAEKQKRANMN